MKYINICLLLMASLFAGCGNSPKGGEDSVETDVKAFADAYFNYEFPKAAKYCTPESERWLRYASSNVHQADVEVLRNAEEGASIEINDISYNDDDTTGTATVTARNYMRMDTIGNAGHIIKEALFKLPIVLRNGKWLIKMEDLPRSEKRNRDSETDE